MSFAIPKGRVIICFNSKIRMVDIKSVIWSEVVQNLNLM